ncbi:hypothetical protein [Agromyces sp. NPDC058110]|uniref:DUF7882 family protein n=1 Tax=Agromyces sp. NPDC058110 TaxID=3346345 RepID=UPI0036D99A45
MGTLYYGDSQTPIGIDDRALTHLQLVIITKLRRGEAFTLSWRHTDDEPRGRTTIWLSNSMPLRFVFDEEDAPELNHAWVEELMKSANSTGGVQLVPENLDSSPIATTPEQPVGVGVDVQQVED